MGDEIFEWILHIVGNDAEKKNFCTNIEHGVALLPHDKLV